VRLPGEGPASPTKRQLDRLCAFAMIAWDDLVPIRVGFRMTKGGVSVYVKQAKRSGNTIEVEASGADVVCASIETLLATLAAHTLTERTGKEVTVEFVRGIIEPGLSNGRITMEFVRGLGNERE